MLKFSIPAPQIFNFKECLWFLHRNYDEILYQVDDISVTRAISINGHPTLFKIQQIHAKNIEVTILHSGSSNCQDTITRFIKHWFDLARDLAPFYRMLGSVPDLAYMSKKYWGLRLMGIPDMLEAICWCIMGQQINLTFAYKMKKRLVEGYGTSIDHQGQRFWMFPTAEALSKLTIEELRPLQFSRQKAQYLSEMGTHFLSGQLSQSQCHGLDNHQKQLAYLQSFKGIGPWTANYVLMKTFGETTSVPWGDTGLLSGLQKHALITDRKDRYGMDKIFGHFSGFESYLVLYLWRSLTKYESEK